MKTLKNPILLILALILIFPVKSYAVYEFNFDFGYDKQIYGVSRQNSVVSRNYSAGISSYLFDLTAIDLNFSSTRDTNSQNDRYGIATNIDVISQQSRVNTNVFGVGIKQMLVGRGSRLTPIISAGYARQFITSSSDITVEDTVNSIRQTFMQKETKQSYNSLFGSFTLQLKLTERFSLKGTVRTLFPAFEFNKAKDNIKYLVGFSWIF